MYFINVFFVAQYGNWQPVRLKRTDWFSLIVIFYKKQFLIYYFLFRRTGKKQICNNKCKQRIYRSYYATTMVANHGTMYIKVCLYICSSIFLYINFSWRIFVNLCVSVAKFIIGKFARSMVFLYIHMHFINTQEKHSAAIRCKAQFKWFRVMCLTSSIIHKLDLNIFCILSAYFPYLTSAQRRIYIRGLKSSLNLYLST